MDEEADFSNLLSQSAFPTRPTWTSNEPSSPDPWANPFSSDSPNNPFASATSPFGSTSAYVPAGTGSTQPQAQSPGNGQGQQGFRLDPESPREEISPYVQKLEEDDRYGRGTLPDPPSVIAAREQEVIEAVYTNPYADDPNTDLNTGFQAPYSPPSLRGDDVQAQTQIQTQENGIASPPSRKLPSDLIDEDLLAASDPSISLKKAFVKSASAPRAAQRSPTKAAEGKKAYVFTPGGRSNNAPTTTPAPAPKKEEDKKAELKEKGTEMEKKDEPAVRAKPEVKGTPKPESVEKKEAAVDHQEEIKPTTVTEQPEPESTTPVPAAPKDEQKVMPDASTSPAEIPLPSSSQPSPAVSRVPSPLPAPIKKETHNSILSSASDVFSSTPSHDRVAVSPLDAPPPAEQDYGFQSLSIGGTSTSTSASTRTTATATTQQPPALPPKTATPTATTWDTKPSATSSRFAGKGWGALDEDDDLFGPGGPSVRSDPWGGGGGGGNGVAASVAETDGWADPQASASAEAGPSQAYGRSAPNSPIVSDDDKPLASLASAQEQAPVKRKSTMFQISIGDPTRMGDPVRGYTVYTVRTRTTSPHYRKNEFSVLRRFSEFLWLFDALTQNNPGVIVPPMPDKQPFGRFQDQFIETRRQALQRCLTKITSHPILQLDPDLRMFLESDSFATESKSRRLEVHPEKTGLLANWTGPRYFEQDDWFESRKNFLEALESQLKGLSKSIEGASKARLEMAITMGDYADSMSALADSDLGSAMCAALARLSDLARHEKEVNEEQAKGDVMHLLNMADEYVRFIGSVRLAFAARIKAYHHWQGMEKEVGRMKTMREKMRQQGKLGDRVQSSLAEINEAERRVRDTSIDFENISKLIKSEFVRFERERVEEFKAIMESQLDKQIQSQKDLIGAWEDYHAMVLKMVQKSQGR